MKCPGCHALSPLSSAEMEQKRDEPNDGWHRCDVCGTLFTWAEWLVYNMPQTTNRPVAVVSPDVYARWQREGWV
jgi:hypothetical protein